MRGQNSKPYEISRDDMGEAPVGWQGICITYYGGDNVLVDDQDDPIRDILKTVGPINKENFATMSGKPYVRLVRNERLEVDFEIAYDPRAYADAVLNYGKPVRSGDNAPPRTARQPKPR